MYLFNIKHDIINSGKINPWHTLSQKQLKRKVYYQPISAQAARIKRLSERKKGKMTLEMTRWINEQPTATHTNRTATQLLLDRTKRQKLKTKTVHLWCCRTV